MSNGFTVEYDNDTGPNDEGFWEWWEVRAPDGNTLCKCDNEAAADNIAMIWNSLTTLATQGYDALECQKALPELVRTIQIIASGLDEATASEYENRAVDMRDMARDALTRLRVQEVDNG